MSTPALLLYLFCTPHSLLATAIDTQRAAPKDNHERLVIFVLLIWQGMVESARTHTIVKHIMQKGEEKV